MQWDKTYTSDKIEIDSDMVTFTVREGGGFKSVLGDTVPPSDNRQLV